MFAYILKHRIGSSLVWFHGDTDDINWKAKLYELVTVLQWKSKSSWCIHMRVIYLQTCRYALEGWMHQICLSICRVRAQLRCNRKGNTYRQYQLDVKRVGVSLSYSQSVYKLIHPTSYGSPPIAKSRICQFNDFRSWLHPSAVQFV